MKSTRPAVDVARGASYLIASNILTTIISVAAFAVIARILSREDMGGLAVLLLVAAGATLLTGLGVGSTATRFVASFEASGDSEKRRQAGYACLVINGLGTVVIVAATYLSADALSAYLLGSASRAVLLRLLTLEIAALGINYSLTSILTGLKRFREISLINVTTFAVRQGLVVILLELGWGLAGVVVGWGVGDALNSMALAAYTMKFLGPPKLGFGFRKLLGFSAPLFAGEIASYASGWFDRALLVPLVPLAQLGSYQVAITAFGILNSMSAAISGTLFPFYSHFYAGGGEVSRTVDLENAVKSASRYVSFFTIPLSVGLAVTALPAATLLAGNIYADAAIPVAILSISLALACQARALGSIFIVLGKTVTSAILTIASLSIPILMGFAIIPYLGIAGAAIVRGSSLIISLAISVSILRMILRLRFDTAAYRSTWLASLAMAGAVLVVEALNYSKYLLPVYVAVGAAVFILALRSLRAVNREDLDLMSDFLEPRLGFVVNWLEKLLGVEGSSLSASAAK